jgi:3',5'-cyclic AMP phosphodiesterase CpdA
MRLLPRMLLLATAASSAIAAVQDVPQRGTSGSVKFGVIGDSGTGAAPQFAIGRQMADARGPFPFDFVIMLGDNLYGGQDSRDFVEKFERPYASLLQAGVKFYASLGNHDRQTNRFYKLFNMDGQRYYTFARGNARFIAVDTNLLDEAQLAWIDETLKQSREEWKICFFHHPLYSHAGRHGGNVALRVALEPLFLKHGVDVVFSGHDHVYERIKPQKGITYFVSGAGGQLRRGDLRPSEATAASFDQDQTFMLVEVDGGEMRFQARTRTGAIVDSGTIHDKPKT